MEQQIQSELADKLKGERERIQIEAQQAEEKIRAEFQEREERARADATQRIQEMEGRALQVKQEAERMKAESEAVSLQKQRELETKEAKLKVDAENLQLDNERKLREERIKQESDIRAKLETEVKLKEAENITQMDSMRKQIDELKRKAESTSSQLIGEAQEVALENVLRITFPNDLVEPVQKGMSGADCILKIRTNGNIVGTIVFECKRTKQFLSEWIGKLKDNQRTINAELAVLITQTFPSDMKNKAGLYEGIWLSDFPTAIPVITALRDGIIYAASIKSLSNGSDEKSQKLFEYITSTEFRGNLQTLSEIFISFESDLAAEERAFVKQCKRRRVTNARALTSIGRIHGSLQAMLGEKSMPELEMQEQKQIEA
jgi:hypothetical protein